MEPVRVEVMRSDPNPPGDNSNRLEMMEEGEGEARGYQTVQRFTRGGRGRPVYGWFVVGYAPTRPSAGH